MLEARPAPSGGAEACEPLYPLGTPAGKAQGSRFLSRPCSPARVPPRNPGRGAVKAQLTLAPGRPRANRAPSGPRQVRTDPGSGSGWGGGAGTGTPQFSI